MKHLFFFSMFLPAILLHGAIETNSAALKNVNNSLVLQNMQSSPEWNSAPVEFRLYDGKSKKFLPLKRQTVSEKKDSLKFDLVYPECTISISFSARDRIILGKGVLTNTGKAQLWPEITLNALLTHTPEKFWGGDNVSLDIGNETMIRRGIKGRALKHIASARQPFPLAAVSGKRHSIFLGHVVYDPVSYNCATYDPQKKILSFAQRFVADPGQKIDFTFTLGAASAAYGIPEGVIQQYYDALPECWEVNGK